MARKSKRRKSDDPDIVARNRKATHDYHILDSLETGMVLTGSEIKSIRDGKISLAESYVRVDDGELWLIGAHIAPYAQGGYANHDATRPRKLLVHKRQIADLQEQTDQKGMTIVPLRVAIRRGKAKVDIAVAKAKQLHDKRAAKAERESKREIERSLVDRH